MVLIAGGHIAVVQVLVEQTRPLIPSSAKREAVLSATCSTSGFTAQEAAEAGGYTEVSDYLETECARLRLLARVVSGAVSWDLVDEVSRKVASDQNDDRGTAKVTSVSALHPDWLQVERLCTPHARPFVPVGRRCRFAFQLLAFGTGANLCEEGRSLSPLRALCDDLQHAIAKHVWQSPRLWV